MCDGRIWEALERIEKLENEVLKLSDRVVELKGTLDYMLSQINEKPCKRIEDMSDWPEEFMRDYIDYLGKRCASREGE